MKQLFVKYRELILYVFFGGLTTLVNWGLYWLLANPLGVPYLWATAIAQIASILFAYVTNRKYVFRSKASGTAAVAREAAAFFGARLLSGILDVAFMWLTADLLHWNDKIMKLVSNVFVMVFNYVASKLVIFRKK